MIAFVHLPGAGQLVDTNTRTRLAHRRSTCRLLTRYKGRSVVEVDVIGATACVVDGISFPVRWCQECGISALAVDWRSLAACAGSTVDFFTDNPKLLAVAIALCRRCPVGDACAEYGSAIDAAIGVWGGHRIAA